MCVYQVIIGRSHVLLLLDFEGKIGFAMVYTVVSVSLQASKQALKQGEKKKVGGRMYGRHSRL